MPARSDGSSNGRSKRGLRPPPPRQGSSSRSRPVAINAVPTAAQPSTCASRRIRDHSGGGIAPATRCATAAACSTRASGSCCAASAALVAGSGGAVHLDCERSGVDAWHDLDLELEGRATDLREPEPVLLDEIEREPVGARRTGCGDLELQLDPLAGADGMCERRSGAVPHDRVAEPIEPVERRLHALLAVRAPGRRAGILERDPCRHRRAGARRLERPGEPAGCQRPFRDAVLADEVHDGATLVA